MQPFTGVTGDAVALADPGKICVIYLPHGGVTAVNLAAAQGALTARWYNPRAGIFGEPMRITQTDLRRDFRAPDTNDWVLLLERPLP